MSDRVDPLVGAVIREAPSVVNVSVGVPPRTAAILIFVAGAVLAFVLSAYSRDRGGSGQTSSSMGLSLGIGAGIIAFVPPLINTLWDLFS